MKRSKSLLLAVMSLAAFVLSTSDLAVAQDTWAKAGPSRQGLCTKLGKSAAALSGNNDYRVAVPSQCAPTYAAALAFLEPKQQGYLVTKVDDQLDSKHGGLWIGRNLIREVGGRCRVLVSYGRYWETWLAPGCKKPENLLSVYPETSYRARGNAPGAHRAHAAQKRRGLKELNDFGQKNTPTVVQRSASPQSRSRSPRGGDPFKPRVPPEQMMAAKQLQSPLYNSSQHASDEIIEEGRKLYEGRGACLHCHGKSGRGNGPAGAMLRPAPRNFTNCKFHNNRADGELFWVIKNGSPGTGMVPLIPSPISEAEAWKIVAYIRTFCKGWRQKP